MTDRQDKVEDVRERVDGFVFLLYQALWMYPIYCISFILNTIWYQEIADDGAFSLLRWVEACHGWTHARCPAAYMQLHGKPSPTPVADMIRYERPIASNLSGVS